MKRRNADCGKIRRPIKRNKIAEGMYGSNTILYMKFLILWAIVITADFMFMFRFEFLWPFWLLLRSVHDSFKYKGLAFSVLFVCIAITSDLVCLFFIPVHWLLFAASTYVWVQYVWHTDKGICLPTIILWMLFVYLEAAIRWKDSRHMPHLDLCRPFAAHCIGYPVVTLGFGFKSYVGYRMRQRKQREVAKENEFYMQLLQQALPQDENVEELQNSAVINNSNCSNNSLTAGAPSPAALAQTIQTNLVTGDHQQHHHHHNNSNHHTNSSINHSIDDKSNSSTSGQVTANQISQSTMQQHQLNNHQSAPSTTNSSMSQSSSSNNNNSNSNNSASSNNSKNAQSSSKFTSVSNTTTTANGHISNSSMNGIISHKSHRRSMDKDKDRGNNSDYNNHSSNSCHSNSINSRLTNCNSDSFSNAFSGSGGSNKVSNSSYMNHQTSNHVTSNHVSKTNDFTKDKDNWDSNVSSASSTFSTSSSSSNNSSGGGSKDNKGNNNNVQINNSYETQQTNGHHNLNSDKKSQANGNVIQYEVEEIVEPTEKVKGRRNRTKKDNNLSSKDNHHNNGNITNSNSSQTQSNSSSYHHHHHNSSGGNHHKDSNANSDSSSSSSASGTIVNIASHIVTKICETCLKLEAEIKKYRNEISHMKQIENELRQKIDSNQSMKSCLQAKQRENDELEKRIQDLTSMRQSDLSNYQNLERRLNDERRQRQSVEAQLNNEKKARKLAEEKATRPECSEVCKQRKQQIEAESKQLRRELKAIEDAKQVAEQQGRKFEQELRMFEAEVRNREAQQGTEVLMSALAAMQDKNSTLEKNLSAETRVKLDLFSALGEAKRQLEIKDSMLRNKDEEVLDLKAKIAQLLAVMPTDSLCLPPCSTTGSSMLRMNDTPPLQGPSSPMIGLSATHQQMMAAAHQLSARGAVGGVSTSVVVATSSSGITNVPPPTSSPAVGGNVNGVTQTSSNLDPNATAYTPKSSSMVVSGAEA